MVQWAHLENLVALENQDPLGSQEHLGPKEIWELLETKVVLVFRDPEENLESQEYQVNLVKWDHLAKMESMERREVLEI